MKKTILIFLLTIFLAISYFFVFRQKPPQNDFNSSKNNQEEVILYYGETCPHCKKVEEWLEKNQEIEKKSGLVKKEVYNNKNNSQELISKAKECHQDKSGVGVPFLYDKGKCIVGDQPIIDYLSSTYQ